MLSSLMETFGIHKIGSQMTDQATTTVLQNATIVHQQPQDMEEYSAFAQFIGQYGRSYATNDEHSNRFETFRSQYRAVAEHNARYQAGEVGFEKAINQFSDFTEQEFKERYLSANFNMKPDLQLQKMADEEKVARPHMIQAGKQMPVSYTSVPEYVNWYEQGKVSESVDQGGCGSCWAFTTATTLESLNAIANDLQEVPRYSVQYLLDCDEVNWKCDGGWMADAYEVTADRGIINWSDYPRGYSGRNYICSDPGAKVDRFFNKGGNEEDMITNERMKELISKQPVGVAIHSNFSCLQGYSKGIVTDHACHCSNPDKGDVNHAVTVIGYGKSDESSCKGDYWLIKNSWGSFWGDNGHFKLCADRGGQTAEYGTCQINSYVQWPNL